MGRTRLVSGGSKRRNKKRKAWVNMTPEEKKRVRRWVPMTEIKNVTGISFKDLRLILAECNLWDKKLPSRYAVECRMARWDWTVQRYEWDRAATLNAINDYVKAQNERQSRQSIPE